MLSYDNDFYYEMQMKLVKISCNNDKISVIFLAS